MRLRFLFTGILLSLSLTGAWADEIYLGFADGNNVTSSAFPTETGEASAAILLDASTFWMYEGCQITGLRVGLTSSCSSATLFVTTDLSATPLYSQKVKTLYEGWNDISFSQPITFPQGDIYVGYTVSNASLIGCSGDAYPANNWTMHGADSWQQATDLSASICIEAIVDDAAYTHHDAHLLRLTAPVAAVNENYMVSGYFRNNTPEVTSSLTVACHVAGQENTETIAASCDEVLPGEMGFFSFEAVAIDAIGNYGLEVTITAINGQADTYPDNSRATTEVSVYSRLEARRPLLEFFTTARCVNCPTGHSIWERVLHAHPSVIRLAHHAGYYTDDYTVPSSETMTVFYNANGATYAPAAMINRTNLAEAGAINGSGMPTPGPVFYPEGDQACEALIQSVEGDYAPLVIDLTYDYEASSRTLTIRTEVTPLEGFAMPTNPMLNILATEDDLWGYQSGSASIYQHNDVVRSFVTGTWGQALTFEGTTPVSSVQTLVLDEAWNPANMHLIAFVSNHNPDDVNDCQVANATSVYLDITEAFTMVRTDVNDTNQALYDLQGRPLKAVSSGLHIQRGTLSFIK